MSVYTALSGLNASTADIANTSNNIANVGTVGYHRSRAEFSDLYAMPPFADAKKLTGLGTQLSRITKNFNQGNFSQTGNTLDLAVQGQGMFVVSNELEGGESYYTRAGIFGINNEGYVVNSTGNFLQVFPTADDGTSLSLEDLKPLQIPNARGEPAASTMASVSTMMPTGTAAKGGLAAVPSTVTFDPTDDTSYSFSTPMSIFDEDGTAESAMLYYVMTDEPTATTDTSRYEVHMVIDGVEYTPATPATVAFDGDGIQIEGETSVDFSTSARTIAVDFKGSELGDDAFSVLTLSHDGDTSRGLSGLEVDGAGVVWANYSDTEAIALGRVAMANFSNLGGLQPIGDAGYRPTNMSGDPIYGESGVNGYGNIRSGSLEQSNVDLTSALVDLISAQRNYQASAKAMETSNSLSQTVMNMRT